MSELAGVEIVPEYLALVSADTLMPVTEIRGEVLALIAARVGATRLIDNHLLSSEVPAVRTSNGDLTMQRKMLKPKVRKMLKPKVRKMLKPKVHIPRAVPIDAHQDIHIIDREVATPSGAPTTA